jgi:hypothetical protein
MEGLYLSLGQSRCHEWGGRQFKSHSLENVEGTMTDSPYVVHQLLKLGQEAAESSSSTTLWCERKTPKLIVPAMRVSLGRLAYHSHGEPGS